MKRLSADIRACPFCDYDGPSRILWSSACCIVFEPVNPVVEGHVLIVPVRHVEQPHDDPEVMASVARAAALYVSDAAVDTYNLILNGGRTAGQTVPHLHLHLLPRREGDGVRMPWSDHRDASGQRVPANRGQDSGKDA